MEPYSPSVSLEQKVVSLNGRQVQKFLLELLPVVQSWARANTVDIYISKMIN